MRRLLRAAVVAGSILLALSPTRAQVAKQTATPRHPAPAAPLVRRLGAAEGWAAYTYKGHLGQVCYITGFPSKREPPSLKRRPPVMMVTHRPSESVSDVVSFDIGSPFKDGSDATLEVDSSKFALFTKGDTAWSRTADLDKTIVAAMAKGNHAVIEGTAQKGPTITDSYSLSGFSHALALIDKACGVTRESRN
jgi:hypothetical protein